VFEKFGQVADFRNFYSRQSKVMNKIKPLDQDLSVGANSANHTAKIQNKIDSKCSILDTLKGFAEKMAEFAQPFYVGLIKAAVCQK